MRRCPAGVNEVPECVKPGHLHPKNERDLLSSHSAAPPFSNPHFLRVSMGRLWNRTNAGRAVWLVGLVSFAGCARNSNTALEIAALEAELTETADAYQTAVGADYSSLKREDFAKHHRQLRALVTSHSELLDRMHKLLREDHFEQARIARLDRLMQQVNERIAGLKASTNALREAADQLEPAETAPEGP
jgi:hypothetical protein